MPPVIISLKQSTKHTDALTLNCTSTGSPATTVTWLKDGAVLNNFAQTTKVLRDGRTALYDSILELSDLAPNQLAGVYGCIVQNAFGSSDLMTTTINGRVLFRKRVFYSDFLGLQIIGNEFPLYIGQNSTIQCTSDLYPATIQWLHGDQVVVSSNSSEANISFTPVNESVSSMLYTCIAVVPYGTVEKNLSLPVKCMFPFV